MGGIPSAVLKQGEAATNLQKEFAEGKFLNPGQAPEEKKEVKPEVKEIETPVIKDDSQVVNQENNAVVKDDKDKLLEQANQRYSTLQGMIDKQRRDFEADMSSLKNQIQSKDSMIQNLNMILTNKGFQANEDTNINNQKVSQASKATGKLKKINPEDFSGYGEEMVDLASGYNLIMEENQSLREELNQVGKKVQRRDEVDLGNEVSRFESGMDKHCPSWRALNEDPIFANKYLSEHPAYKAALNKAAETLNAVDAASIFKLFIRDTGYVVSPDVKKRYNIQDEIVPEAGGGGGDLTTQRKNYKPVSRIEYQKACNDFALKKIDQKTYDDISSRFQRTINDGLL